MFLSRIRQIFTTATPKPSFSFVRTNFIEYVHKTIPGGGGQEKTSTWCPLVTVFSKHWLILPNPGATYLSV